MLPFSSRTLFDDQITDSPCALRSFSEVGTTRRLAKFLQSRPVDSLASIPSRNTDSRYGSECDLTVVRSVSNRIVPPSPSKLTICAPYFDIHFSTALSALDRSSIFASSATRSAVDCLSSSSRSTNSNDLLSDLLAGESNHTVLGLNEIYKLVERAGYGRNRFAWSTIGIGLGNYKSHGSPDP